MGKKTAPPQVLKERKIRVRKVQKMTAKVKRAQLMIKNQKTQSRRRNRKRRRKNLPRNPPAGRHGDYQRDRRLRRKRRRRKKRNLRRGKRTRRGKLRVPRREKWTRRERRMLKWNLKMKKVIWFKMTIFATCLEKHVEYTLWDIFLHYWKQAFAQGIQGYHGHGKVTEFLEKSWNLD